MSGYTVFARFYDDLTADVDYRGRAKYYDRLIRRHSRRPARLALDLCCGTGSLSRELALLGYEVIGVDASSEMLSVAAGKEYPKNRPLFLCQKAEELDLYGTVDACVCALDSLNHLPAQALAEAVGRVSLFLAPGGVFAFDVNTSYKHEAVLSDNVFAYETDGVFCVWRNRYRPRDGGVEVRLDFFERLPDGGYRRGAEGFTEHLHSRGRLTDLLERNGLFLAELLGDDTLEPPSQESQRTVYVAVKEA